MEDLSHDQGDPHNQEVSADDAGGVKGAGSPRHGAGPLLKTSLKSAFKLLAKTKERWRRVCVLGGEPCDPPCPEQQAGVWNLSRNRSGVTTELE